MQGQSRFADRLRRLIANSLFVTSVIASAAPAPRASAAGEASRWAAAGASSPVLEQAQQATVAVYGRRERRPGGRRINPLNRREQRHARLPHPPHGFELTARGHPLAPGRAAPTAWLPSPEKLNTRWRPEERGEGNLLAE